MALHKRTVYNRVVSTLMDYRPIIIRRLVFSCFRFYAWLAAVRHGAFGRNRGGAQPHKVMGLCFANPVGVAAGFDRQGLIGRRIGHMGFGHMEIGTLTPEQLPLKGELGSVTGTVKNSSTVLGINIGPNPNIPCAAVADELLYCLRQVWRYADYITINLCSPAAAELLVPEKQTLLYDLLKQLKLQQAGLGAETGRHIPIAVKLKFKLETVQVPPAVELLNELNFDALLAVIDAGKPATPEKVNRWLNRDQQRKACELVERLHAVLGSRLPIISVGGICSIEDVRLRLSAGASLVQIHNGLVYHGPHIMKSLGPLSRPLVLDSF